MNSKNVTRVLGRLARPSWVLAGVVLVLGTHQAVGDVSGKSGLAKGIGQDLSSGGPFGAVVPDESDESIGSLPLLADPGGSAGGQSGGGITGYGEASEPVAVYLVGPSAQVLGMVKDSWGEGHFTWSFLGGESGEQLLELGIHGDVTAVFDPNAPKVGHGTQRVQLRVQMGHAFSGGSATLSWNGVWTSPLELVAPGSIPLPGTPLMQSGALHGGSASLDLFSYDYNSHGNVTVSEVGGLVHLSIDSPELPELP